MTTAIPALRLRQNSDKRVKAGHPWIFSNELDGDVAGLPLGGTVDVFDAKGAFVGRGYANPRSLIAVRLMTRARKEDIDSPVFLAGRLRDALAYREAIYPGRRSMRLVHAEGDRLPGLVVDRFGDVLSVQITTLGIETRKDALKQALIDVFAPSGAVLRGDARMRDLEGLADERGVWFGDVADRIEIDEHGVKFVVDPLGSQKTGHFYDQAENRRFAAGLSRGRTVLDVYCNTGGFALHALVAGAKSAVAVDIDEANTARAAQNAALNGVGDKLEAVTAEGRTTLEQLVGAGKRYGVVMLDPPAFAKSRKVASKALAGYRDVNALGLALVAEGGFLVTSSCSYHVEEDRFVEAVVQGAQRVGRKLVVVRRGEQAPDHPVVPGVPESRYLKHYVFHVTAG
jgi:23S rRNA (cytosine1962-C5)-methyltransferase